jgi:hypothetical protein
VDLCCAVVRRKSASLRFVSMSSDTIFLSNNSDVEVTESLLLVHCLLLPRAVCLSLSLSLSLLFLSAEHRLTHTAKNTGRKLLAARELDQLMNTATGACFVTGCRYVDNAVAASQKVADSSPDEVIE